MRNRPDLSSPTVLLERAADFRREVDRQSAQWHPDARRLAIELAHAAPVHGKADVVLAKLAEDNPTSSIRSRLERAGLPSAKQILVLFRLTLALHYHAQGYPMAEVSYAMGYSSPQAFSRHVRERTGFAPTLLAARMTAARFWVERVVPALRFDDPRWTTLAVLGLPAAA